MPRKSIYVVEGYDGDDDTDFLFHTVASSRYEAREIADTVGGDNATIFSVMTLREKIRETQNYLTLLLDEAKPGGVARVAREWDDLARERGFVRVNGKWVNESDLEDI